MLTEARKVQTELYVDDYSLGEYLDHLRDGHPRLYELLSPDRCRDAERHVAGMNRVSWEFEDESVGGRGLAYNNAQKSVDNRKTGMLALLKCFDASFKLPGEDFKILDVLGGDGTVARFCRTLGRATPTIFTADISKLMVDASYAQGLPCVRQPATASLFRDRVLDGVLIGYGSHHLDDESRRLAVREAGRTLKAGGRLVLHDFEIGGRCARWFDSVVHPFSRTGHPHRHFSRHEMLHLLTGAGFVDVKVFRIRDPFTLHGGSPEEAKHAAIMHMYDMYGLIKIPGSAWEIAASLERHITETLGRISIRPQEGRYVAEIPRQALVAVGTMSTAANLQSEHRKNGGRVMSEVEGTLRDILIEDLFVELDREAILPTFHLREDLGIDSLGFIELKAQVETRFSIAISDDDFTPENFRTITALASLIHRQRGSADAQG